jgi:cellulose synthase/poly-beta-1,6-N-acetylglucosamine synthase-like glycosyltransferase
MVSVIIPAYNAEGTIARCLTALTGQSYPNDSYEVLVVDDGSADKTGSIAQSYSVNYIRQENQGPAAARNRGARAARGDIILFTDADCVPDKDWLREMLKPFKQPEVVAVKGAYGNRQKSLTARFAQLEFEERFELLRKVKFIDMVDTYSAGFRKEIFLQLGGFDTSFPVANNEDTELSYRMSKLGYKMVFNPQAIVYHLNHPDSIIKYARLKFWRGYWRLIVYKRFPGKMLKDSYTPQTLKLQILFFYLTLVGCLLVFGWPQLGVVLNLAFLGLGLSLLPFTVFAMKLDPLLGCLSPLYLLLRAATLGAGTIWGIIAPDRHRMSCTAK